MRGYQAALKEAGLPAGQSLIRLAGFNQDAMDQANDLMDDEHPDGVFCFNDSRSIYLYQAAAARHLSIGRDLNLVGVDNHQVIAETMAPPLSTIELPHYEMGFWAVRRLLAQINPRRAALPLPDTRAVLPPLDQADGVRIHCALIRKGSTRLDAASDPGPASR